MIAPITVRMNSVLDPQCPRPLTSFGFCEHLCGTVVRQVSFLKPFVAIDSLWQPSLCSWRWIRAEDYQETQVLTTVLIVGQMTAHNPPPTPPLPLSLPSPPETHKSRSDNRLWSSSILLTNWSSFTLFENAWNTCFVVCLHICVMTLTMLHLMFIIWY